MCGIAGIVDFKTPIDSNLLGDMLKSIYHRGPDDEGKLTGDGFALGMRRLSIIDVTTGHQPIFNEDNTIVTFFNGEIYNYLELRQELIAKGHRFKTHSDTEVIVHLYEEYKEKFVSKLNGMFAILIGDIPNKTFSVYRDHYGIKPLYYTYANERLVFASEAKAILNSKSVSFGIEPEGLVNYFNYGYIPSPKSIFKSIRKLPAGHFITIDQNGLTEKPWYSLSSAYVPASRNRADVKEEIRWLLEDSVKLQMRSDVPVGAYLSGGVDSSLMCALAARHTSIPLSTFSVGFTPSEFDELPYARLMSKHIGSNHHEIIVSAEDAINQLPELMWYMDEPMGDSAILPAYMVSKLAVKHVKVALSGLGGDELFGGYGRYSPIRSKFDNLAFIPKPILKAIFLPLFQQLNPAWGKEIDKLVKNPASSSRYHERIRQMSTEMMASLLPASFGSFEKWIGSDARVHYDNYRGNDEINARMFTDIQLYMNDQLLHLTDRMSMAVSLEARVPLLDKRLVELSISIPSHMKISTVDTKIIFKEAIQDLMPQAILNRPKWGFAAPYKTWTLSNGIRKFIDNTLNGNLVNDGLLDKDGIRKFLGNNAMIEKHPTWVWPIIALEVWYSRFKKEYN